MCQESESKVDSPEIASDMLVGDVHVEMTRLY